MEEADSINYKGIEIDDHKKQDFLQIKNQLEEENQNFVDPLFPHSMSSIGQIEDRPELSNVKWMRVGDITANPVLFKNGPKSCDVNQGKVKDCWFLAPLAILPHNTQLFNRVVPTDQEVEMDKSPGIFHFKFWQYGEWVDVVVDDYLPTLDGQPCFLKSDMTNEFWPAMVEKAYAKLYGNYTCALNGGQTTTAMEDLTGGLAESFQIKNSPLPFKVMLEGHRNGCMMVASILGHVGQARSAVSLTGLANFHAYSITKVLEFEDADGQIHQLIRIRNPWGDHVEWTGAWADNSFEWKALSENEKFKIGYCQEENGEFFMAYKDFIKHFDGLDICHVSRDSFVEDKIRWHKEEVHGSWVKGTPDGGLEMIHKNPQYLVELKDSDDADDTCTFVLSLLQQCGYRKRADGLCFQQAFNPIGLVVIPIKDEEELPLSEAAITTAVENEEAKIAPLLRCRANTKRFEVLPGKYIVLPFTNQSNTELKFMLRLFSEMPAHLTLVV